MGWPNPFERRFWALVFSYRPPAISAGPILTIVPIYLTRGLGLSQAESGHIFWIPPLACVLGYFAGGWAADLYASTNARPIALFVVLTVFALPFALTASTSSVSIALLLISLSTFVAVFPPRRRSAQRRSCSDSAAPSLGCVASSIAMKPREHASLRCDLYGIDFRANESILWISVIEQTPMGIKEKKPRRSLVALHR